MNNKKWLGFAASALTAASCLLVPAQTAHAWNGHALRYTSSGGEVRELQGRLKLLGYYHGSVDGDYGWHTYWAVRDFQYQFGMKIDGVAGSKTKEKIGGSTQNYHGPWSGQGTTWNSQGKQGNSTSHSSSPANASNGSNSGSSSAAASASSYQGPAGGLSSHDIKLMAMLVYGEARGEPLAGQVGVADVILHRLKDPKYPNTVAGVIYQPGAFSAASNGQMDQVPNAEAYKAVHDAISGDDPVGPALYYFNPAKTSNAYMWSRPQVTKIGHHIFTT